MDRILHLLIVTGEEHVSIKTQDKHVKQRGQWSEQKGSAFNPLPFALLASTLR